MTHQPPPNDPHAHSLQGRHLNRWKGAALDAAAPDGSETKLEAAAPITVTGTGTAADPYRVAIDEDALAPDAIVDATYDGATGQWTFRRKDGTTETVSTPLENFLASASFDAATNELTFTLTDGTTVGPIDLSDLVDTVQSVDVQVSGTAITVVVDGVQDSADLSQVVETITGDHIVHADAGPGSDDITFTRQDGSTFVLTSPDNAVISGLLVGSTLRLTRSDGGTVEVNLAALAVDTYADAIEIDADNVLTITRNDGVTLTADLTQLTEDTYTTSAALSNGSLTLTRNDGGTVTVDLQPLTDASIIDVTHDPATGDLTFTFGDGTTKILDLPVEQFLDQSSYDAATSTLTLTMADGTTHTIDLSDLIDPVTAVDATLTGTTLTVTVDGVSDSVDLGPAISAGETVTVLTEQAPGRLVYNDEDDAANTVDVSGLRDTGQSSQRVEVTGSRVVVRPDGSTTTVDASPADTVITHTLSNGTVVKDGTGSDPIGLGAGGTMRRLTTSTGGDFIEGFLPDGDFYVASIDAGHPTYAVSATIDEPTGSAAVQLSSNSVSGESASIMASAQNGYADTTISAVSTTNAQTVLSVSDGIDERSLQFRVNGSTREAIVRVGDLVTNSPAAVTPGMVLQAKDVDGAGYATLRWAPAPTYNPFQHANEIHVDPSGSDSTGTGAEDRPVRTLTKAVGLVGQGDVIVVHPGVYAESITIATQNIAIVADGASWGSLAQINGTITVTASGTSVRLAGLRVASISHTGGAPLWIDSCTITTSLSSSSTGYLELRNSSTQGATVTRSAGITLVEGCRVGTVNVSGTGTLLNAVNTAQDTGTAITWGTGTVWGVRNVAGGTLNTAGAVTIEAAALAAGATAEQAKALQTSAVQDLAIHDPDTATSFSQLLVRNPTTRRVEVFAATSLGRTSTLTTDEFTATAGQTNFTLSARPSGTVALFVNGVRAPRAAVSWSQAGPQVLAVYSPAANGNAALASGQRVTFDYVTEV